MCKDHTVELSSKKIVVPPNIKLSPVPTGEKPHFCTPDAHQYLYDVRGTMDTKNGKPQKWRLADHQPEASCRLFAERLRTKLLTLDDVNVLVRIEPDIECVCSVCGAKFTPVMRIPPYKQLLDKIAEHDSIRLGLEAFARNGDIRTAESGCLYQMAYSDLMSDESFLVVCGTPFFVTKNGVPVPSMHTCCGQAYWGSGTADPDNPSKFKDCRWGMSFGQRKARREKITELRTKKIDSKAEQREKNESRILDIHNRLHAVRPSQVVTVVDPEIKISPAKQKGGTGVIKPVHNGTFNG